VRAPAFCGGLILKYLRRTKDPEHSLESARWYRQRLVEFQHSKDPVRRKDALRVLLQLGMLLNPEELERLGEPEPVKKENR
jgi:hypothetical protein